MTSYLLDTHVLLWWLTNDARLRPEWSRIIEDTNNRMVLSVASAWELCIKHQLGKVYLEVSLEECFSLEGFSLLNISLAHISTLATLPHLHRDPFDRMLVAQALSENFTVLTDDEMIRQYVVRTG